VTACHVCGFSDVEPLVQKGTPFRLVSSDVQPVSGTTAFSICPQCLVVQKAITPAWRAMAEQIYADYDINHQSHGAEPTIFDTAKGSGPRSFILLRNFLEMAELADEGRLLDVGCSNGNLLKSFHKLRPAWKLSGTEQVDQWKDTVLALPGVEAFYSGQNPDYAGKFDIISLSHVLEHVPDPIAFLKTNSSYLKPHGRILLALPNLRQNPIDLVIADHCSHFDEDGLSYVAREAGLRIELLSSKMLPKELVAVLSPSGHGDAVADDAKDGQRRANAKERCLFYFELLDEVRRAAKACRAEDRPFGVMGSSIAACWMTLELGGKVDFFVDEDRNRVGHQLMGLPILSPADVPDGAAVFIPMSVAVAEKIIQRWKKRPIDFRYVANNRSI
jgi:SAM-dependent methyltransferase